MPRLIYAAHKDAAGERDVEAEVDQHVPKFQADADRPAATETRAKSQKSRRIKVGSDLWMSGTVNAAPSVDDATNRVGKICRVVIEI